MILCDTNVWLALALSDHKHHQIAATASPKLWMDAYLAAFALSGSFQFVTTDKAFHQFRGLDLVILA